MKEAKYMEQLDSKQKWNLKVVCHLNFVQVKPVEGL